MGKSFYKYKGYAHFDRRLSIAEGQVRAQNPVYVVKHGFYPFLHFTKKINRYFSEKDDVSEKREPKKREIFYAAHIDRYIYQYYAHLLNNYYNSYAGLNNIDNCAVAYRTNKKGKCNIDFAYEAFKFIKMNSNSLVVVGDFTNFFDNLDHVYLKQCLQKVLEVDKLSPDWFAVYKNICSASYVNIEQILNYNKSLGDSTLPTTLRQLNKQEVAFSLEEIRQKHPKWIRQASNIRSNYGIPQGSPISGVLANVYMIEFDSLMKKMCEEQNAFYMRYSDDFIFIIPNQTESELEDKIKIVFGITGDIGNKGRLLLKKEKTKCAFVNEGKIYSLASDGHYNTNKNGDKLCCSINFLGFSYNGKNIDLRNKTKHRNENKIAHKTRRLYKFKKGYKLRKDGSKVNISLNGVKRTYYPVYRVDMNEQRKSTFNSYIKRSMKIFRGEEAIHDYFIKRKGRISKIINKTISQVEKQRQLKEKAKN